MGGKHMSEKKSFVETIHLAEDVERRVAFASVRLSDVVIRGIAIWRSPKGHLRVYFPAYRLGAGFDDAIRTSVELRAQLEADVISAYKEATAQSLDAREAKPRSLA
jgi:hypothetical protein